MIVRARLNLASLDKAFNRFVERGGNLSAPLERLADAHAASVEQEFRQRTGFLVDGSRSPWSATKPFGVFRGGPGGERSGRLRASWHRGHAENVTVITPNRVERGTRVPYAAFVRGGTGQFLTRSPLVITPRKSAKTRRPYPPSDPRYYAQWWFFLFEFGVAMTAEAFFHQRKARRPHGAWHPNLRRYGERQILNFILGGRRAIRGWRSGDITA